MGEHPGTSNGGSHHHTALKGQEGIRYCWNLMRPEGYLWSEEDTTIKIVALREGMGAYIS